MIGPGAPESIQWIDAFRAVHPERTSEELSFHAFKGGTEGWLIDFILHTPEFAAIEASIDRSRSPDRRFPSDHYAVTAILSVRGEALEQACAPAAASVSRGGVGAGAKCDPHL